MKFYRRRLEDYIDEYLRYFKNVKDISKKRKTVNISNTYELINMIKKEFRDRIGNEQDYLNEVVRIRDEINSFNSADKAINGGVLFLSGILVSKFSEFLRYIFLFNDALNMVITVLLGLFVFRYLIVFNSIYIKRNENFYHMCLNILQGLKVEFTTCINDEHLI